MCVGDKLLENWNINDNKWLVYITYKNKSQEKWL